MPPEKPDPEHLDWLVANRAANQRVSAKLYRLLREYPDQIKNKPIGPEAQMLVAVAFSLWRSAFLSDKTGRLQDSNECAEGFLEEMLMTNAIAFGQDRKAKDWTFNYYAFNAKCRLEMYADNHPKLELGQLTGPNPKERWQCLQNAFEKAVEHFERTLKRAKLGSK